MNKMVDQINEAVDIIVPFKDYDEVTVAAAAAANENKDQNDDDDDDEDEKIISLLGYKANTVVRPLYLVKRKKYVKLIQEQLYAKNRLLLKTLYKPSTYYSCEITEMQEKVSKHMIGTDAYLLIMKLNETNQDDCMEKYLDKIDQQITSTLTNLLSDQSITLLQWHQMKVNRQQSEIRRQRRLNSLYFLPDTRRVCLI